MPDRTGPLCLRAAAAALILSTAAAADSDRDRDRPRDDALVAARSKFFGAENVDQRLREVGIPRRRPKG